MTEDLIKAENVSKKFCRDLKRSMIYGVQDIAKSMFGLFPNTGMLREKEFWAVEDISFELKRGQCLGLIGPNGSGKSTFLKMLNGIIEPDKGRIEIRGKVGALIEVGAGFHPMLTGRENVYVNGAILGFSKKEIDRKLDAIVDFAELDSFIDTPVKHYSSGMYVRLGFAVAAQMEPDVLLIDEVLAVGDVGFRAKCTNAINKILKNAAVIYVSHLMPQIARISTDICVLRKGSPVYYGNNIVEGIEVYYESFKTKEKTFSGSGRAAIHEIISRNMKEDGTISINYHDELDIEIHATVNPEIKYPTFNIGILNQEFQLVAQCNSLFNKATIFNTGASFVIKLSLPSVPLNPGTYYLSPSITDETRGEILTHQYAAYRLNISGDFMGFASTQLVGKWEIQKGD